MKKILLGLIGVLLLCTRVYAVSGDDKKIDLSEYQTLNFEDTLAQEEMEHQYKSYSENDKQVTIYLFRGNGCGYCRAFLTFLNSITDEYGKYFKVVSFEVWGNKENNKLMKTISNFMNDPAGGVPYIIIGDEVFPGYASQYDESIKAAILDLYDSEDRYDVFEEYNKAISRAKKMESGNAMTIIICNIILVCGAVYIINKANNKRHQELLDALASNKRVFDDQKVNHAKKK